MAKNYLVTVKCPHCLEENMFIISPPNRYGRAMTLVRCFNSEKQTGCRKEMNLNQETRIWTEKNKNESKVIEDREVRTNPKETPAILL